MVNIKERARIFLHFEKQTTSDHRKNNEQSQVKNRHTSPEKPKISCSDRTVTQYLSASKEPLNGGASADDRLECWIKGELAIQDESRKMVEANAQLYEISTAVESEEQTRRC